MVLEIGDVEKIVEPSPGEIAHYVRFMPPQAPFVILTLSDDVFMQATPSIDRYRVELFQGKLRRIAQLSSDETIAALQAFGRRDDSAVESLHWKRLSFLNDPYSSIPILVAIALVLVSLIVANFF